MCEVDSLESCGHLLTPLRARYRQIEERDLNIFRYIEVIDKIRILEDEADASSATPGQRLFGTTRDILALKPVLARSRAVSMQYSPGVPRDWRATKRWLPNSAGTSLEVGNAPCSQRANRARADTRGF